MEPSKFFDEKIKQAMGGFEADLDAGAWEAFEQRLEGAEQVDADNLLRERLSEFTVAAQPGSWEAMQQLIEADETAQAIENEVELDQVAHEKLSNFEVPYQSKHWALMARRLEEEFSLRQQIYRYKFAEISLVALLLLTFVRFLPYAEEYHRPAAELDQQEIQSPEIEQAPTLVPENILEENNSAPEGQGELFGTPIATAPSENTNENSVTSNTENIATLNEANTLIADAELAADLSPALPPAQLESIAEPLIANVIPNQSEASAPIDEYLDNSHQEGILLTANAMDKATKLATLNTGHVQSKYSWEELPALKMSPLQKPKNIRFSIFTTADVNYITTPADQLNVFDTLVNTSSHNTLAVGYGGGILVSLKKERFEFQTGGIYSFKRYIPNTPVFLFETVNFYVKEDFKGIQLDILQTPLSVSYHAKDAGKWRLYGSGGVTGHFVTSAIYEIEQELTEAFDPLNPPTGPDDFRTIRKEKEFPTGLFDGGQLRDNFYMSVNAGVGVERYLSPKWVIFLQPNYQHYLFTNGIGTNNDKIYTTSLYLGTKFSLK